MTDPTPRRRGLLRLEEPWRADRWPESCRPRLRRAHLRGVVDRATGVQKAAVGCPVVSSWRAGSATSGQRTTFADGATPKACRRGAQASGAEPRVRSAGSHLVRRPTRDKAQGLFEPAGVTLDNARVAITSCHDIYRLAFPTTRTGLLLSGGQADYVAAATAPPSPVHGQMHGERRGWPAGDPTCRHAWADPLAAPV